MCVKLDALRLPERRLEIEILLTGDDGKFFVVKFSENGFSFPLANSVTVSFEIETLPSTVTIDCYSIPLLTSSYIIRIDPCRFVDSCCNYNDSTVNGFVSV